MSFQRPLLNFWMRNVERRKIERAKDAAKLRSNLELQAKLMFFAPRGTQMNWLKLSDTIDALEVRPKHLTTDRTVLYFHGGAFTFGSPDTHKAMMGQLARRLGARVILPRYRLAPENPFPAAIDDVETAWAGLVASGVAPGNIVVGGDSAGGALAFSLLGELCKNASPMPAGVFGFSPLADQNYNSISMRENEKCDVFLPASRAKEIGEMYLGAQDPNDPRASPIKADFTGASPVWLTVGDTEILLDDTRGLAQKIKADGGQVVLQEEHDLPHVWPILHLLLPEARQTLDDLADWIKHLPGWQVES